MFKKKEVANKSSQDDVPARVVKKGAANKGMDVHTLHLKKLL